MGRFLTGSWRPWSWRRRPRRVAPESGERPDRQVPQPVDGEDQLALVALDQELDQAREPLGRPRVRQARGDAG